MWRKRIWQLTISASYFFPIHLRQMNCLRGFTVASFNRKKNLKSGGQILWIERHWAVSRYLESGKSIGKERECGFWREALIWSFSDGCRTPETLANRGRRGDLKIDQLLGKIETKLLLFSRKGSNEHTKVRRVRKGRLSGEISLNVGVLHFKQAKLNLENQIQS